MTIKRQSPLSVWLEPLGRMLLDYPREGDPHAIADTAACDIRKQMALNPSVLKSEGLRVEVTQLYRRKSGRKILATVTI